MGSTVQWTTYEEQVDTCRRSQKQTNESIKGGVRDRGPGNVHGPVCDGNVTVALLQAA